VTSIQRTLRQNAWAVPAAYLVGIHLIAASIDIAFRAKHLVDAWLCSFSDFWTKPVAGK